MLHQVTEVLILHNSLMITSRVMTFILETEDARTEYGLPKIWVKFAHAYTADTRLSSFSPPRTLLESLGTRLVHTYLTSLGVELSLE